MNVAAQGDYGCLKPFDYPTLVDSTCLSQHNSSSHRVEDERSGDQFVTSVQVQTSHQATLLLGVGMGGAY